MTSAHPGDAGGIDGLAGRLRALRNDAGVSQTRAAEHVGVSQGKISRAETGRFLLDPPTVGRLAELYGVDDAQRAELVAWAEDLRPQRLDSRLIMQRGTNHFQDRIRRMEEASSLVRSYQPGLVLGSLQTEAYATAVFSRRPSAEAAASVAARMHRHRMMLEDTGRSWTLIQTEGALLWHVGGPELMAEQIDRLVEVGRLPNVRIGVITHTTPVSFTAGHGFHIYDRQAVQIGTRTATALTSDERDVATYESLFAELERVATFGEDARAVLGRLADRYRALSHQ
jgi:transcriptional regulator with XRE-family HTH domain